MFRRRLGGLALAGVLVLGAPALAACGNDAEQEAEELGDDIRKEVEEGLDEIEKGIDEGPDGKDEDKGKGEGN